METESKSETYKEELLDMVRASGSIWSLFVFANHLSEAEGLTPVYDLSGVIFKHGTSAKDGTLDAPDTLLTKAPLFFSPHGENLKTSTL